MCNGKLIDNLRILIKHCKHKKLQFRYTCHILRYIHVYVVAQFSRKCGFKVNGVGKNSIIKHELLYT